MPTVTDIRRVFRDHVRFTGDGQPNAPVGAPLPGGDPRSGMYNLDKYEIRDLLIAILQTQGDPDALQDILRLVESKAEALNSGKVFGTRSQAVAAGQTNLPSSLNKIFTREGFGVTATLKVRTPGDGTGADPLFETSPYWSIDMDINPDLYIRNSGRFFGSRAEAVAFGQNRLPGSLNKIIVVEGTAAAPIWTLRTPGDGTGPDPLFDTAPYWSVVDRISMTAERAEREAAIASLEGSRRVARTVGGVTPLLYAGSKVLLWLEDGLIKGPGLDCASDDALSMSDVRAYAAPRIAGRASSLPISTDGRSLYRIKGEIAKLKAGIIGTKPKLLIGGDSWTTHSPLTIALRARIAESYPMSGWGYWNAGPGDMFRNPGGLKGRSGSWTYTGTSVADALPYGGGIDGNLLWTTGTDATAEITNVEANEIRIFTRNYGGTWRYRVNDGAWVVVVDGMGGGLKVTTISGLPDTRNTVEIDTVGNTGRVALAGYYLTKNAAGFEVLHCGNGGARGYHLNLWAPYVGPVAANLQCDMVAIILGTNDYRVPEGTITEYISGINAYINAHRGAVPDVGIVCVCPPLSGWPNPVTPQTEYRDAMYENCISQGIEFYNATDDWGPYERGNAQGLWADRLHLNTAGGTMFAKKFYQTFLGD